MVLSTIYNIGDRKPESQHPLGRKSRGNRPRSRVTPFAILVTTCSRNLLVHSTASRHLGRQVSRLNLDRYRVYLELKGNAECGQRILRETSGAGKGSEEGDHIGNAGELVEHMAQKGRWPRVPATLPSRQQRCAAGQQGWVVFHEMNCVSKVA